MSKYVMYIHERTDTPFRAVCNLRQSDMKESGFLDRYDRVLFFKARYDDIEHIELLEGGS